MVKGLAYEANHIACTLTYSLRDSNREFNNQIRRYFASVTLLPFE